MQHYLDGDLDIDNNLAERVLRIVTIGRKNWLFARSATGAERAAIIYSLIASCKLCATDPFEHLRDVLDRITTYPASKIAELTVTLEEMSDKSRITYLLDAYCRLLVYYISISLKE